jgi:uncharacterized membrane protein HdeD (DUF308 family)
MSHLNYHIDHSEVLPSSQIYDYFKKHWGWFLAAGIILVILGTISLGSVYITGIYSIIAFGILMGIGGFVQLIEGIQTKKWSGFFFHILLGLLYISSAIVLLMNPGISLATMTLVVAGFFFAAGLFRMLSSLIMRFTKWGWTFFSGLVTFVLAILVWKSWPVSSLWVIGTFVGIDLLFYGWSIIVFAFSSRAVAKRMRNF